MAQLQIPQHMFDTVKELPDPVQQGNCLYNAVSLDDDGTGKKTALIALNGPGAEIDRILARLARIARRIH